MSDTARQILNLAEALWLERGFNGFSYHHLAEPLGLKNAAIHYHYPGKVDLGLALIARFRRRFLRQAGQIELTCPDPWGKLEWYVELITHQYAEDERICPTGMLAAELATLPAPMQAEARLLMTELYEWCAAVLRDGVERGHFRFAGRAEDKAALILATLQGALQLARFDARWLGDILKQLRLDLGAR